VALAVAVAVMLKGFWMLSPAKSSLALLALAALAVHSQVHLLELLAQQVVQLQLAPQFH
jgi:hypothetical protein